MHRTSQVRSKAQATKTQPDASQTASTLATDAGLSCSTTFASNSFVDDTRGVGRRAGLAQNIVTHLGELPLARERCFDYLEPGAEVTERLPVRIVIDENDSFWRHAIITLPRSSPQSLLTPLESSNERRSQMARMSDLDSGSVPRWSPPFLDYLG